jgi:hypothetical protein
VQRLPEQERAALVLTELGDLSHAEVAAVMGYEPRAIKGLVFRARAALAERRDARDADCADIRLELAAATGGGLRRGRLRYHLETCPGCVAYLEEVRRQRKLLGMALPVVPTLALKNSVMGLGAVSAGGASAVGGAAAGGAATVGGTLLGGTAVKLAVAGAIVVGGAGVATEVAVRDGGDPAPPKAPSAAREGRPALGAQEGPATSGGGRPSAGGIDARRGARDQGRRALGQQRAERRGAGRSAAGSPRGKALGQERGRSIGRGDAKTVGGGRRKATGEGSRGVAPGRPETSQGGGQGAAGSGGGQGGGGEKSVVPRRDVAPGKPVPKATPPAASGGGTANRPEFQHSGDAVPSKDR